MKLIFCAFIAVLFSTSVYAGFKLTSNVGVTRANMANYLYGNENVEMCEMDDSGTNSSSYLANTKSCVVKKGAYYTPQDPSSLDATYRKNYEISCSQGLLKSYIVKAFTGSACDQKSCSLKYYKDTKYDKALINNVVLNSGLASTLYEKVVYYNNKTGNDNCGLYQDAAVLAFLRPAVTDYKQKGYTFYGYYPKKFSVKLPTFTHDKYYNAKSLKKSTTNAVDVKLSDCTTSAPTTPSASRTSINGCSSITLSGPGVSVYDDNDRVVVGEQQIKLFLADFSPFVQSYSDVSAKLDTYNPKDCTSVQNGGAVVNNANVQFGLEMQFNEQYLQSGTVQIPGDLSLYAWKDNKSYDKCVMTDQGTVLTLYSSGVIKILKPGEAAPLAAESLATINKSSEAIFSGNAKSSLNGKVEIVNE